MTYKINKTDGSLLTEIIDSAIDQTATDLTLIGKNVSGFGEYINENFVKLLENFASTSEPNYPIPGQIWFDTSENRLKVYDGNNFRIGSGPIVSATPPLNPIQGDFWIDSNENQLYFYDGTDRVLAGPIYKDSQGISGFEVETIKDNYNNPRVIVKLWVGQQLIGIFSGTEVPFTPASTIGGFSSSEIKPGFNASNLTGLKFNVTASSADALVATDGVTLKTVDDFLLNDVDNYLTGTLTVSNQDPLILGAGQELAVKVSPSVAEFRSQENGQDFKVTLKTGVTLRDSITVKNVTSRIGIFNNDPDATLHIGGGDNGYGGSVSGDVIIEGNLTVKGTTTTVESTTLVVADKLIELATSGSPSDANADGGGIVLKGDTDHIITWDSSTDAWITTENIDLQLGKEYRIASDSVLSYTTLGSSVVNSSLTSLGTLSNLNVANLSINNDTISSTGNIVLEPGGPGFYISASGCTISDIQDPVLDQDAATKIWVTTLVGSVAAPWVEKDIDYIASPGDRILVSTMSGPVIIAVPHEPDVGTTVRFVDVDGTFGTNNLIIARETVIDDTTITGTSISSAFVYGGLATTTSGAGAGMIVTVTKIGTGTAYSSANTTITVTSTGTGYATGDTVTVSGADLGGASPANDLTFDLGNMDNILGIPADLTINTDHKAFGLIYVNQAQGWKYAEF